MARKSDVDVVALGRGIRERRLALDLSLSDLERRSGVASSYVSKLERGLSPRPGAERLEAIAVALGVPSWRDLVLMGQTAAMIGTAEDREQLRAIAAHTADGSELTDSELRIANKVADLVMERLLKERAERLAREGSEG